MTDSTTVESPIGTLLVESDGRAITQITLPGKFTQRASMSPTSSNSNNKTENENSAVLSRAVRQLDEYFAGKRTEFDLPLELEGTAFQKDVWLALAEIPYGKTISYAELASMVGRPSAFRAVGQANGANPIPIVLPCHRVIASGGGIGGYGGGLEMKRRLLALEGVDGSVPVSK
jgi:methylated-DNA-[protein]-cysteine S-methyltransferase